MALINVPFPCNIASEKLQALDYLVNALLPGVVLPTLEYFGGVFVVPDDLQVEFVNALFRLEDEHGTYVAGTHSRAQAVHIKRDDILNCFIVLGESLTQRIDPQNPGAVEGIGITLLEELFHVKHYSTLWQLQGQVCPEIDFACPEDLIKMCFNFYDEYIVNRWKFTYLAQHLDNFRSTDFPLTAILDQAQPQLFDISQKAIANSISNQEAWLSVLRCAYRNIFELLARHAAPRDAIPPEKREAPIDLTQSQFYRTSVESFWHCIEKELDNAYTSDLKACREALEAIVQTMTEFFANIGIIYQRTGQESWSINFNVLPY